MQKKIFSKYQLIYLFLFFVAIICRTLWFGQIPEGVNGDEASSGVESLSLYLHGIDSWGYRYPVYFVNYGGGLSVLYSYLALPFIHVLGFESSIFRLLQLILGLLSIYVFYRVLDKIYGKTEAIVGLFLVVIMPWQIMLCRWGLHANIVPFFVISGFYFFVCSIKNARYLILTAIIYGLGLYAYETTWLFIVGSFFGLITYLLYYQPKIWKYALVSSFIFLLFLLPILLLILVNNDTLEEIRTKYISIPRLPLWRGREVGLSSILDNALVFSRILITGQDGMIWNTIPFFGLFYPISIVFFLIGVFCIFRNSLRDTRNRCFSLNICVLWQILLGVLSGILFSMASSTRINIILFAIMICMTVGICQFYRKLYIFYTIIAGYVALFLLFIGTYFLHYNEMAKDNFSPGFNEALQFAERQHMKSKEDIYVFDDGMLVPKVLFYNKIDTRDFRQSVVYKKEIMPYLMVDSFLYYHFYRSYEDINVLPDRIYIAPAYLKNYFRSYIGKYSLKIKSFGNFLIIYDFKQIS